MLFVRLSFRPVVFRSLVGRPRNRKDADFVLIGNQLIEGDLFAPQRIKVRSPWDQTIVTQYDLMEYLLDYTFHSLGLTTSVGGHPIFLTEPLGNPNYCRGKMNELLFECYDVPAVATGIPEVLAWRWNREKNREEAAAAAAAAMSGSSSSSSRDASKDGDCTGDALIVSCGFECSTVVPMVGDRIQFQHASRLSLGGSHLSAYYTHALQTIHHPQHIAQWNGHRVQEVVEKFGQVVSGDGDGDGEDPSQAGGGYRATLASMARIFDINGHTVPDRLPEDAPRAVPDVVLFRLPHPAHSGASPANSAQEAQIKSEKKELQRQRLRQLMRDRKEKKLIEDQAILADWTQVRAAFHAKELTPSEYLRQLKRRTFADETDFLMHFDKLKKSLDVRLNPGGGAAGGAGGVTGEEGESSSATGVARDAVLPSSGKPERDPYPLLSRPDEELTPEELRSKGKQKRSKALADMHAGRRREKEARLREERERREQDQADFQADPRAFIDGLRRQREAVQTARDERMRVENATAAAAADANASSSSSALTGRRSNQASKKRMALLAEMGGSGGSLEAIEKQLYKRDRSAALREANFGMDDEDWKIYEDVRVDGASGGAGGAGGDGGGGGDAAESEEERDHLAKLDTKIREYDPQGKWSGGDTTTTTAAAMAAVAAGSLHGPGSVPGSSSSSAPPTFVVPLWVDRVRLPEFFFQPHALTGLDEAGLGEMCKRSLDRLAGERLAKRALVVGAQSADLALDASVVRHVFVTGGPTLFPNFVQRIHNEIRQLRPIGAEIRVKHARHPQWDAWRGAALLCRTRPFDQLFLTRAEWTEKGIDYLRENEVTNVFMPTPPDETPELARKRKR